MKKQQKRRELRRELTTKNNQKIYEKWNKKISNVIKTLQAPILRGFKHFLA